MRKRFLSIPVFAFLIISLFFALPKPAGARDDLKNTDPDKYYILLDLKNQVVTVYERDESGEYTHIVRRFICTSGRTELDPEDPEDKGTPTPRGIWKIGARERFGKFASFANEYARYWTQIVGGNYFHSVMFSKRSIDNMKSSPYNSLGRNLSHGCVRLYVEDAKWLYYYACPGTVINVSTTEKANPELTKKLKSDIPFKTYNEMQKHFYDNPELPNYTAWTVTENADMRTGNGSEDRRIRTFPLDTEIEVLQVGDPWCKISYDGREGYIKTAFLTFERGVMQSREDADIVKSTVYMVSAPEKGSTNLFKVPTYTSVQVLDDSFESYVKVSVWGTEGYLPKSSLVKGWGLTYE